MTDVLSFLRGVMRPRILMDAAKSGVSNYRRDIHLRRLLGQPNLPGPQQAAVRLICLEQEQEEARSTGAAAYSAVRHVEIMIALLGESQALLARSSQEKASTTSAFLRLV